VRATETLNIAPMGNPYLAPYLQGGGVFVNSGTVSIVNSQVYSNRASPYVRAHAQEFPSPQWDTHVLLFVRLIAGRRCFNPGWLSDHLIVHHKWELSSWLCARSCSKVPITPMGKLLTRFL
jgi:hypothetical protein